MFENLLQGDLGINLPEPKCKEIPDIFIPGKQHTFEARVAKTDSRVRNRAFTEDNYPLTLPEGPRNLVEVDFGIDNIPYDLVSVWGQANRLCHGRVEDLLELANHQYCKDLEYGIMLVALGSCDKRGGASPCFYTMSGEVCLGQTLHQMGFNKSHRFLMARLDEVK